MFHFLHTYNPEPILISIGPIDVHWYGLFIVTGILLAMSIAFKLAEYYKIPKSAIIDSSFWLIIGGIAGARLYHVLLELPYYLAHPLNIFKIWHGGLAIHGAIIAGIIITWFWAKKNKLNFWLLTSVYVTGLTLAQAIGRWGNYFNQELFGLPTDLPWGIPILPGNRIMEYYNYQFFHPTFLYESMGSLIIFLTLLSVHVWIIKKHKTRNNIYYSLSVVCYLSLYSLLRFILEFIRIDSTPVLFGFRFPQLICLVFIIFSVMFINIKLKKTSGSA